MSESSSSLSAIASAMSRARWARIPNPADRVAETAKSRAGLRASIEGDIDPTLPADERDRIATERVREHYRQMGLRSAAARRARTAGA